MASGSLIDDPALNTVKGVVTMSKPDSSVGIASDAALTTGSPQSPAVLEPASPREVRRLQRIEMSRQQILDTAEELFSERGYHETSLKDVASRCQYSVGSIYTFFDNKDKLYEQVLMRRHIGLDALNALVPEALAADERLVKLAEVWIDQTVQFPAWGSLTAEVSRITRSRGVVPEAWVHQGEMVHQYVVGVIAKGQQEGTLRDGSPSALAHLYQAVVMSFVLVTALSRETAHAAHWSSDAEMFLRFLYDTFSQRAGSQSSVATEVEPA